MEHDRGRGVPISTGLCLYEQVLKQSEFCDVTVKLGEWEKSFHRCVLAVSPFFACAIAGDFRERETGVIEVHRGSALAIETSIKFLYGLMPTITLDNVGELLDMAEFLLIPELKHSCVCLLRGTHVDASNCSQFLELSYTYDLQLVDCHRFAMSHLPGVIRSNGLLNVSEETLFCLLTNETLSYVSTEDWFRLVVNWTRHDPRRSIWFPHLFSLLRLDDCDPDFVRNVVVQDPLVVHLQGNCGDISLDNLNNANDDALVILSQRSPGDLTCLNLRTLRWHSVAEDNNKTLFEKTSRFGALSSDSPVICYIKKSNNCILRRNLETSEVQIALTELYRLRGEHINCQLKQGGDVAMYVTNGSIHRRNRILPLKYSILFEGTVIQPVTRLFPVLTIIGHFIHAFCGNADGISAMLCVEKSVIFLYNGRTCQFAPLPLHSSYEICYQDRMTIVPDGFAVFNNNRLILLKNRETVKPSCFIKQIRFCKSNLKTSEHVQYFFCGGDRWFKFVFQYGICNTISYIYHDELSACGITENLDWSELQTHTDHINSELLEEVLIVNVRKDLLKCHMSHCPHCSDIVEDPEYVNANCIDEDINEVPPYPAPSPP